MDRQEGYYWVKLGDRHIIAFYEARQKLSGISYNWYTPGEPESLTDSDFEHINEIRIKEPGELPEL